MYPQHLLEKENVDDDDADDGDAVKYFQYGSKGKKKWEENQHFYAPECTCEKHSVLSHLLW